MGGPVPPPADPPAPAEPEKSDNTGKIAVGVIAGVAVLVLAVVLARSGSDSDKSCALSAAAVAGIAVAVNHGKSADAVIGSAAFTPICKSFVESVVNDPEAEVEAEVQVPTGESVEFQGTGQEFVTQAPPAPDPSSSIPNFDRILDCVRSYDTEFLVDLCTEGTIEPSV
jgi:hypothetical protein